MKLTQSEFIKSYCNNITEKRLNELGVFAVPCNCEDDSCEGWAMMDKNGLKAHIDLYLDTNDVLPPDKNHPYITHFMGTLEKLIKEEKEMEEKMSDFKPKNLDEALRDIIGSALNDNSTFYEDSAGRCSENYIPIENFDSVEDDILNNLKESKYINIEYQNKKEALRLLLEGENGFYGNYLEEVKNGSIESMTKVINKTINEIHNLFKV